jgi:hypothetical protein
MRKKAKNSILKNGIPVKKFWIGAENLEFLQIEKLEFLLKSFG